MSTLTDQRKAELRAEYAELKTQIAKIDNKYSLSYIEVELDFPPTLGLEHLTYTPKTDSEISILAEQQVAERYDEKRRTLDKSYQTALQNVNYSIENQKENSRQKLAALAADYQEALQALLHKLVNAGLLHSSVKTDAQSQALADYNQKVSAQNAHDTAQLDALSQKSSAITSAYLQSVSDLEAQKNSAINLAKKDISEKEEKNRLSIEKYNKTLDEKEVKYQASCKRAEQYAVQAEYDRGLQAARLYAELGESGVAQQVKAEKLVCFQSGFRLYTRTEAHYLLSIDSFVQAHLEDSYSAFLEWVNTVLRE